MEAILTALLACAGAPSTPSEDPEVSMVEHAAETVTEWLDNGGDPWGLATYDDVNVLRDIADEYAMTVSAEDFPSGEEPTAVAAMVDALADRVEPFCTE